MSDHGDISITVAAMVDAVNRGDFAGAATAFNYAPLIVEDIAPFRWSGPSAVSDWLLAMGANAATLNALRVHMALGDAARIEVQGDRAYACFPGELCVGVEAGELRAQGMLTFVLERQATAGWLIDTLVWSGSRPDRVGR